MIEVLNVFLFLSLCGFRVKVSDHYFLSFLKDCLNTSNSQKPLKCNSFSYPASSMQVRQGFFKF